MSKLSITPINPNQETGPMGYCPYMDITSKHGSYKTLTDGLIAPEKRMNNDNITLKQLKERMDMLNLKVVSQGNKQEIQMENGDVIPSGPVNMIKDYMSPYKGGRKTRKNKRGKTRKRKSKNTRKK